jgi:hypothetical protein
VVTVPVEQPGQSLVRPDPGDPSDRPAALRGATLLLVLSSLPFLLLGAAAAGLPMQRWLPYTGPWPRVHTGQTGYRVLGACVLLLAAGYLLFAVQGYRRRLWARTAVVTLTAIYDVTLVLVLLADQPRTGWLVTGAAVVLCSLAAVVRAYQPEVDRYLADEGRHDRYLADEGRHSRYLVDDGRHDRYDGRHDGRHESRHEGWPTAGTPTDDPTKPQPAPWRA